MNASATGCDVLVVGGGLAGGACALRLAEAGADVLLVEREAGAHDKVCGEFLSGEAASMLDDLGVGALLADAPRIARLELAHGRAAARADLPFLARGLSRQRLDEALLARAGERGARIVRGLAVRALEREPEGGLMARLSDGSRVRARRVVLATGKHDLRGHRRPPPERDLVGLKAHLALAPQAAASLADLVHLTLFAGGYAGLQRVEGGRANLCLVAPAQRVRAAGGFETLVAEIARETPSLSARLAGARLASSAPVAIARIPYGFVHRPGDAEHHDLLRVGDQAGVVPSFCGDGMAMALYGGLSAAQALAEGAPAQVHHARLAQAIGPAIARARTLEQVGAGALGRSLVVAAARLVPGLAARAAAATRVPEPAWRALVRTRP
ncbi:NAD(P)/FAD-dependent oxidoreductase [Salinarimonas ramus]|uniref:FAD-binding domain-containing protein n=1 Tax=Salinarimonas ramus TaxID=690164 RepID=A0A917Q795_9HYPH|nr:FAD-dependent monooxygenase [Salinarimonas ramus]GGK32883.1 hypothetical protein GCM10011322_19520 [Salinarimonas ramus]